MSNYTGGARIGPVSGSRRTAFTSKGLAVSARQETISVPSRPRFDFFHANDASERIVNTGSGPLIGRIDAVSPESIRDPPKPPPNQTKFQASSPYMGYDVAARNKELSRRDLIKLPKRKEAEGSDVHSLQQILRNPSTSLHDSKDGVRDHGSMDVTSSIYNDWTTHLHQEQEINFELDSSGSHSGCTEEILSFPPTPSGRFLQPSTISSYDLIRDLDEKSEDHMSDDDEIISFSGGDSKGFPTVAGFKLIQRLGGGGFASVYKAMDKSGVVAACKVIAMNRKTPEKEKKVVTKEIQVHSTLVHDNIIRLKDALIVPDDGQTKYTPGAYLLMEMAHGGDLFDKIGSFNRPKSNTRLLKRL
ncbi:Chk1 protein kinase [Serendipita sp. 398]|nr:Chk1 protein kinase [Serendipita sp. 398]